jgi:phospholipase C
MAASDERRLAGRLARTHDDPIEHVVVLMFENHSFDQMLGCFREKYPGLDGVDSQNPRSNRDSAGNVYYQRQSDDVVVDPDPKHDLDNVRRQLNERNSGFVIAYEEGYPGKTTPEQRQRIMDYFGLGDLPALHALAEHFTICDHWFSSVPGPTWTNRFFVHSGTSKGRVRMPEGGLSDRRLYLGYDQDTIYDRLNEQGIFWRVYYGDVPQSLVLSHQREGSNTANYDGLERFFQDADLPAADFPQYAFIEPKYFHVPFGDPQNDDHPPHATIPAQALLGRVYNALRRNESLWRGTLLVVVYDEHGGFYDHVTPPKAVPPGDMTAKHEEWTFDRLGVRVPALLVSPWVGRSINATVFDHTSLLKYLTQKWRLKPLTERVNAARSIGEAINATSFRHDTPESVPVPQVKMQAMRYDAGAPQEEPLNEHQRALLEFTELLEKETPAPARQMAAAASPLASPGEKAKRRVDVFVAAKKAKGAARSEPEIGR